MDSVASAYEGGDETLVSADGRTTILPIVMAGDLTQADKNIDTVHEVVHAADGKGGLDTLVTGTASINSDFSQTAEGDLRKGEGIGVPIALVILLLVFGAVVAAGLPIVLSLVAITAAVALTALVGQAFDVSIFAVNMVSMMGLATGIDYSLFIISRFREEDKFSGTPSRNFKDTFGFVHTDKREFWMEVADNCTSKVPCRNGINSIDIPDIFSFANFFYILPDVQSKSFLVFFCEGKGFVDNLFISHTDSKSQSIEFMFPACAENRDKVVRIFHKLPVQEQNFPYNSFSSFRTRLPGKFQCDSIDKFKNCFFG